MGGFEQRSDMARLSSKGIPLAAWGDGLGGGGQVRGEREEASAMSWVGTWSRAGHLSLFSVTVTTLLT